MLEFLKKKREDEIARAGLKRYVEMEYRGDPYIYLELLKKAGLVKDVE